MSGLYSLLFGSGMGYNILWDEWEIEFFIFFFYIDSYFDKWFFDIIVYVYFRILNWFFLIELILMRFVKFVFNFF